MSWNKGEASNVKIFADQRIGHFSLWFQFRVQAGVHKAKLPSSGVANGKIRDAEILVRNPSPRLFGEKFRYSKKVKTNHEKKRLRDLSKTFPRFRDRAKIFRDPRFSRYHSPPLSSLTRARPSEIERTRFAWIHVWLKYLNKATSSPGLFAGDEVA